MKKRLIAIALAVCTLLLFAASVSAAGTGNGAAAAVLADNTDPAETPEITRAAWIQSLVSAFSLTVENDNYPDNYFSDLTSDKPYYHDILTAVDFGVVDTPLGEAFRPEEAATREFAAHTLNYCLGYQMDEETGYTFSEAQSITYPEDLQVAVTRGWFQLSGKNALPEQAITAAEKSAMLADAEAALKGEVINENYQNSYSFAEGVVVIPEGTEVTASDTTLTVRNCPVTVAVGDVIAVYQNGIPVVYLTNAVTEQDGALVLTVTHLEETDAYTGIDAQGTVEASLEDVIPLEDSQLGYYVPETDTTYDSYEAALYAVEHMERTQATASTDASTRKIELVCKRTLTFDGASVDISLKFKNVYVDYKISLKEQRAYVKLSYDAEFSYGIKYDAAKAVNADDVDLLFWGVPGVGGVTISLETELSGSAKGIHKFHGACGVEYTKADGVRVPCNIDAKTMAVSAEGTAKLGLKVKFGVTKLPVVKAYLYASAGATGKLSVKTYNDNALPEKCTHFAVYLYAKYGATGSVKILNDKRTLSFDTIIYNEKNSPIRIVRHYEDGTLTASCTRDGAGIPSDGLGGGGSWFTPGGSIYAGSGWSGGNGNTGWENGDPVVIYTYSTDDDGNATITGYNGKASGLVIPSTIDGHTVVAIGDNVFKNNSRLKAVIIPDTVTEIGENAFDGSNLQTVSIPDSVAKIEMYAFCGCKGLTEVKLPAGLKELGGMAFGECSGLTEITIPKSLTTAYSSPYGNRGGPFGYCENLTTVIFEDGITKVPAYLFRYCTGKIQTVIPDGVTEIGCEAFMNSGLQSIVMPDTVTEIGEKAFRDSMLQTVSIPDSVTKIGQYAFYNCQGLTEVKLSARLEEIGDYAFADSGLQSVSIPDTVTKAGNSTFKNCSALTDAKLSSSCISITASMFEGCSALRQISLPDAVTTIYKNAFLDCTSLKDVTWSKSLTAVNPYAFKNCSSITEITLPEKVTSIGNEAFSNCDGLTSITIPDSVTSLGSGVFYDCDALTNVTLGAGITAIPSAAFEHCDLLAEITIPRRVTSIGDTAFKDCVKFRAVHIPRSVTSISSTAFSYLSKLTIYGVPGTYAETFANANSITFVSEEIPAESLVLDPKELTLLKGASAQLSLSILPTGCTDVVSWKSSDTAVVTVSDTGLVKAVGTGTATIKVVVGSQSASCKVTVGQPVTSISLNKTSLTLEALDSYQLTATVNPSNAANRSVTWASSDGSVASVTQDGLVTALKKGTAVITVSAQDGSGVQKTCTVTVSNTAYICPTPDELESPHNYPDSCSDIWIYTKPGAESLQVTFDARTNMEDGFDYLYIYDASGNQVGKYTGTVLAGQTITVPGDTVRIKLVSDSSGNAWGFKVSRVQSAGDGMPGDLDGDGELTSADVVLLARYLAGAETLTEAQLTAADLNADGVITSADLVLLARKVAGLE